MSVKQKTSTKKKDEKWDIMDIVDKKITRGITYYKVSFYNWDRKTQKKTNQIKNSPWRTAKQLDLSQYIIDEYEEKLEKKRTTKLLYKLMIMMMNHLNKNYMEKLYYFVFQKLKANMLIKKYLICIRNE